MVKNKINHFIIRYLVIGIACVYTGIALWKVASYTQMSASSTGEVLNTSINKVGSDKFELRVHYTFPQGEGEGPIRTLFRNKISANTYNINDLQVWYNPKHPEQSTLDRAFPVKACVYALILIGLVTYSFALQKIYI